MVMKKNSSIDENKSGIILVGMIIGIIMGPVAYYSGYKKGRAETYELTKIVAIQTYDARIGDLKEQINDISQDYEKNAAALRQQQAREINNLETKQITEIEKSKEEKVSELSFMQTKHEDALKETQETYYVKGQVDSRSSIQNQIDSKYQENISNNDWNAPVFSTKR
jgi:hypothetical protein